ncbi:MAG: RNA polymerase sigma factor [Anaerolineae bacterium]
MRPQATVDPDENALVKGLIAGEARAWQQLCELYAEPLYLFIYHRSGDTQVAEDVRQETLLAAVQSVGGYRRQVPLFGWLCGIARHKLADEARRRRKLGISLEGLSAEGEEPTLRRLGTRPLPEEALEASETRAAVVEALWSLPAHYRTALIARYQQGESVETVAARLGRSYKATESLLSRARDSLRRLLTEA